ncbi:hypothetical protein [Chromobacterium amazonense]|uniref:hypothetical protein n=1 Tax=Chromobacterium amazonense TaxID=1382803 RepID=UPI003F7AD453
MESIYVWILNRYGLLIDAGRAIFTGGFIAIIAGIFGWMLKIAQASIAVTPSGEPAPTRALADAWPSLPTGWVPETLPGFLLAGLITVTGIAIAMIGRHLKRFAEY